VRSPGALVALAVAAVLAASVASALAQSEDTGWTIRSFHAEIAVQRDASLVVTETIEVDFGSLQRHGIFREIPVRYDHDAARYRIYELAVEAVTDESGKPYPYTRSANGANERIRVGDPDRTVSGRQTYRVRYRVAGALNAFTDHDELFWNVNGPDWPVPAERVSAAVALFAPALQRATCFQGPSGSRQLCRFSETPQRIEYVATRALGAGEELTIVAAVRKGVLSEPVPLFEPKPRGVLDLFEPTPAAVGGAALVLLAGIALLLRSWWLVGRDRRYVTTHAVTGDEAEKVRGVFEHETVVAEYEPPDGAKPAELGLIVDERADAKDLVATIVDLARRGHLRIVELPKTWAFGRTDWRLERAKADGDLREFERKVLEAIFADGDEATVSKLRGTVGPKLRQAQRALYRDAVVKKWFARDPERVRTAWAVAGLVVLLAGAGIAVPLGVAFGGGLVGLAIALLGLLLMATHRAMPARTARGRELLRRTLGFRRYLETAEQHRAEFAEREGLFTAYLPYAIMFGCVERWATAFAGLDATAAASGWYVGQTAFNAPGFSQNLESFSSHVSSAIVSTTASGGGSGFSGGSSGGGGGGGGGGSW